MKSLAISISLAALLLAPSAVLAADPAPVASDAPVLVAPPMADPAFSTEPICATPTAPAPDVEYVDGRLAIVFRPGSDAAARGAARERIGATVERSWLDGLIEYWTLPTTLSVPDALAALTGESAICTAEADPTEPFHATDATEGTAVTGASDGKSVDLVVAPAEAAATLPITLAAALGLLVTALGALAGFALGRRR